MNKLVRPDRGVIDEQDVKSVLVRQEGKLDQECLERRARAGKSFRIESCMQIDVFRTLFQ